MWEKRRLLIWGKTYPEFSKTYYETVCTGAVDEGTGKLVRIYPITLRYQKDPFKKYDWIEVDVQRNTSDFRPESHRINQDSITKVGHLDTKDGWVQRSKWILREGNVFRSVQALQDAEARDHTSLGLIRPQEIIDFGVRRKTDSERQEWEQQRARALAQKELFVDEEANTRELRFMPVEYHAIFRCGDTSCRCHAKPHKFSILDWEIYALSRRAYAQGGVIQAQNDVINALHKAADKQKRNLHFFLGNTKSHSHTFTIVGLYYPPQLPESQKSQQMSLF